MPVAAVDSNVLIAASSRRDQDHEAAAAIVSGVDGDELPTLRVTNYVVTETLNYVHARYYHDVAVDLYTRLKESAGFELVHATQVDFTRAADIFGTHEGLSFGDATTVAYMDRTGLEYLYSFDDDVDAVDGITRLATADDPFA